MKIFFFKIKLSKSDCFIRFDHKTYLINLSKVDFGKFLASVIIRASFFIKVNFLVVSLSGVVFCKFRMQSLRFISLI